MAGMEPDRPATAAARGRRPFDGPAGQPVITSHARPRLWESVRVRLLIPVLLATAAVAVLGTVQVGTALAQAGRADRSSVLATASGHIGALAHEVTAEYVESNLARRRGTPSTLDQQTALTDAALADYLRDAPRISAAAPELARLVDTTERALTGLAATREFATTAPDGAAEVAAFYQQIVTALLAVADALPPLLHDPSLVILARSVSLAAGLDQLAALQFDLVSRDLVRGELPPTDQVQLAQWVGSERTQVDALTNLPVGGESYGPVQRSVGSATATSIRQVLLDDRTGESVRGLSKAGWAAAQGQRMRGLWAMQRHLTTRLATEAEALGTAAREQASVLALVLALVIAVTLGGAIVMVVRISRRLRQTRHAALTAARVELPSAIANVIAARDAGTVRAALTDSSTRIDALLHGPTLHSGPDEIGELATAFGAVHRQALRLAADQALLRMEVQAMFMALSRRGQTLVQRQIHLIDEFGRSETDPEALARLFALDHLAARMRRNEENLLVLAGGEPGRWITRPVAVVDLLRAAAQEIEEYRRVEVLDPPGQAISPTVAGDAIHLLAELLENATSYSPPSSTVRVSARRGADGLSISVTDTGIGMPVDRLAEANHRLTHPSALTSTLVGTMGLLVVARLAHRHGITVTLDSVAAAGTTATVTLPDRLLLPLTAEDRPSSGRWQGDLDPRELDRYDPDRSGRDLERTGAMPTASASTLPRAVGAVPMPRAPLPLESTSASLEFTVPLSIVEPSAEPVRFTDKGLPRRPAEPPPSNVDAPAPPSGLPDPEAIRARLSSLAGGIAAAREPHRSTE